MYLERFLISPPFGNWINTPQATSVRGSFTWERRRGLLYHAARTLRPIEGGWINQIGLRNPGIRNVDFKSIHMYSLVGLEDGDWDHILDHCPSWIVPEINLGCPNVHEYGIPPQTLAQYCAKFDFVIAKLPPTDKADDMAAMCVEHGVHCLHLSNTLPTERGGESGARLFRTNLPIVARIAARYGDKIIIIAGGGIYSTEQLSLYQQAGATRFSLATVWFTPWRARRLMRWQPGVND